MVTPLLRRSIRPEAGIFVTTIDELCIGFNWISMLEYMLVCCVPLVSIVIVVVVNSTNVIARRRRRLRHLVVLLRERGSLAATATINP